MQRRKQQGPEGLAPSKIESTRKEFRDVASGNVTRRADQAMLVVFDMNLLIKVLFLKSGSQTKLSNEVLCIYVPLHRPYVDSCRQLSPRTPCDTAQCPAS